MNEKARTDWVPAPQALANVESFIIEPSGLGVALRVSIARPVKPVVGEYTPGSDPVIYATDADYHFGTVVDTVRVGSYGGEVAPAVVVGIGYAQERGDLEFVSRRRFLDFYRGPLRDFDAGAYGKFQFGGADEFLSALRAVIVKVEQHVSGIDPALRVLLGTSAGGHFAAYVLTQEPRLFQGYALMSPVLIDPQPLVNGLPVPSIGDGALVRLIQDLPSGTLPSGLRVFLSAGEREENPGNPLGDYAIISNAYRMRTALARQGVATEYAQFVGETHGSVPGAAISRALRFLLPPAGSGMDWRKALAGK